MKKIIFLFALTASLGMQAQNNPPQPTVSVTGEGTVKVVPDQVIINSRIETEGADAGEVKKQNDATVDKIISFLKKQGVDSKNIETDYVNLNKRYNYDDKTSTYVANQAISIKLVDLSDYEEIMRGLLENGLNRIDGVQFKSSEVEKYESEARRKAVLDAKQKATELATPLGQKIGKAVSINEVGSNNIQPVYRMAEMKMSDSAQGQQSIAPGEMEITEKVNVSFLLQ